MPCPGTQEAPYRVSRGSLQKGPCLLPPPSLSFFLSSMPGVFFFYLLPLINYNWDNPETSMRILQTNQLLRGFLGFRKAKPLCTSHPDRTLETPSCSDKWHDPGRVLAHLSDRLPLLCPWEKKGSGTRIGLGLSFQSEFLHAFNIRLFNSLYSRILHWAKATKK